jgi:peptide/nickel transport system substrate-binding protein
MPHASAPVMPALTRRRWLQGALMGTAGLATWLRQWRRLGAAPATKDAPSGQMTWAMHVTIAPTWFDPAETPGIMTPFMCLYALHDALVKPMPGHLLAPSLATPWRESPDGLTDACELRQGVTVHNGDPFTAEDVQFSVERDKGAGAGELKRQVTAVEIVNAHRVRFHLHEPWPDFLTFYGSPATGAGWIVPKPDTERSGSEAFKNAPIGLGPYRFVSHEPGIELVLEANTAYWRKTPSVKRLVMKGIPEATTRLARLKKREADVAYGLYGPLAAEVRRDPSLTRASTVSTVTQWLVFTHEPYDPNSPWSDERVRLAANHAIHWEAANDAETLGYSLLTGSIIPGKFDYALRLEPDGYDPNKARQLLKEAGYPTGFDAGECAVDSVYAGVIEAAVNDLAAVGIRAKVRSVERAAFTAAHREKTLKHLAFQGSGAYGNAATRLETFAHSKGSQSWINDPEIDEWYAQQAVERDRKKRGALLHQIQQKLYDEARFIPVWELSFLAASGPRAAVSGLGLIPLFIYSGPFEDVQVKS